MLNILVLLKSTKSKKRSFSHQINPFSINFHPFSESETLEGTLPKIS